MSKGIFIRRSKGLPLNGCLHLALYVSFLLLLSAPVQAYHLNGSAVAENLPPGTPVGTFQSLGISIPAYSLPAGIADNSSFVIEGNTLKTAAVFDFESESLYTVRVLSDTGEEQTFTVTVGNVNESPVIAEGESLAVTMDENGIPRAFALTLNAEDPDGDLLTWEIVSLPENGTAEAKGTGNSQAVAYVPDPAYVGKDQFEVRVSDGEFYDTIIVSVTVLPKSEGSCSQICEEVGEDNCVIAAMDEDGSPQPFKLTLNASDPDNDILTWSISQAASNGRAYAEGTGYTKAIGYIPGADYNGTDRFEVRVSDGELTDSMTVCVMIGAQNDAPRFAGTDAAVAKENDLFVYMLTALDPDAGDSLTIGASGLPEWLTLSDKGDGTALLSGMPSELGKYIFQLQAQDLYGGIAVRDFTVNVSENIGAASEKPAVSDSENSEDKNTPARNDPSIPGDVDDDGDIDLGDGILGLQVLSGKEPYQPVFLSGDANGDGKIGMAEVLYILRTTSEP